MEKVYYNPADYARGMSGSGSICELKVREYLQVDTVVDPPVAASPQRIIASTMDRLLKAVKRKKSGSMRSNRRSGHGSQLLKAIECKSGEEVMAVG